MTQLDFFFQKRAVLFIYEKMSDSNFLAELCLCLIYWIVSKHTPNSRLDRLNGSHNTEAHYFGTQRVFWKSSMANGRAASLSSCFKETTRNWSRHLYCYCCITLVWGCRLSLELNGFLWKEKRADCAVRFSFFCICNYIHLISLNVAAKQVSCSRSHLQWF